MKTTLTRSALLLAPLMFGLAVAPTVSVAQRPTTPPQMQRMHEETQRLMDAMGQMKRIQERAQEMEQLMIRDLERLRTQERLQEQDQLRIRDQERVRDMAHATSGAAREMYQAMERVRDMLREQRGPWDPEMEREMERLRLHMETMAGQFEEGLQIMERIRNRIGTP